MAISHNLRLTHQFFVDDILIFCDGIRRGPETMDKTLKLFKKETCMVVNDQKTSLKKNILTKQEEQWYETIFLFEIKMLDAEIKYLGFQLKPNGYKKNDWDWFIEKIEEILNISRH